MADINVTDIGHGSDSISVNKIILVSDIGSGIDIIGSKITTDDRQGYRLSEVYESAIYNWAYSSLGSCVTIIWDKPNAPRPELPYVTLAILGGPIPLDDRPQNQYKSFDTWTYTFRKRITLSINVFGYDDCFSKAQLLADSLYLASKILILNSAGIACYGTDGPRDMSQFIDTQWEFRAQLDVFLSYGMTRDDSPGEIQKIGLNGRTIEII